MMELATLGRFSKIFDGIIVDVELQITVESMVQWSFILRNTTFFSERSSGTHSCVVRCENSQLKSVESVHKITKNYINIGPK